MPPSDCSTSTRLERMKRWKASRKPAAEALTEMRRVLGVLREESETAELAPQPGVGQIHTLIDTAQGDHLHIELKVQGEPGPLPASVNLGLYRILEDALGSARTHDQHPTDVTLRFGEHDVELTVTTTAANSLSMAYPRDAGAGRAVRRRNRCRHRTERCNEATRPPTEHL